MRQSMPGRLFVAINEVGIVVINCIMFLVVRVNTVDDLAGLSGAPFGTFLICFLTNFGGFPSCGT